MLDAIIVGHHHTLSDSALMLLEVDQQRHLELEMLDILQTKLVLRW